MRKKSLESFKRYISLNPTGTNYLYSQGTLYLIVYCFEGEYNLYARPIEEIYNKFYDYIICKPKKVTINGTTFHQWPQLTLDEIIARDGNYEYVL